MHFFVKSVETRASSTFERAAATRIRMLSIDYNMGLYGEKLLGFYFRGEDGTTAYALHRTKSLLELDARLKSDPQWPYASHQVIPVTKSGEMIRELTQYLKIEPREFFTSAISGLRAQSLLSQSSADLISKKLSSHQGDVLDLFSQDEEPIDEEGTYTVIQKQSKETAAIVPIEELKAMWMRTLRSQVMHLDSEIELVDYNPVGISQGILIGKVSEDRLREHVENTEIFPDTTVTYTRVHTPTQSIRLAAKEMRSLRRDVPRLSRFDMSAM